MIRFAHPYFIYGLIFIPFFIIFFWLYLRWKQKALRTFGDISVISQLMPGVSKARPIVKFILIMTAFIFLIIGLADPQIGSKLEKVHRKGVDIMICLDVSNSMMAEDIKPNRLEKAKFAISKLIDKLEDDRIGIVVFAGKAFIQLPITADHAAAKMFVSTISLGLIPVQGTAIGEAIKLAQSSFSESYYCYF
jgi:Ca-activated chloride channel family protein